MFRPMGIPRCPHLVEYMLLLWSLLLRIWKSAVYIVLNNASVCIIFKFEYWTTYLDLYCVVALMINMNYEQIEGIEDLKQMGCRTRQR